MRSHSEIPHLLWIAKAHYSVHKSLMCLYFHNVFVCVLSRNFSVLTHFHNASCEMGTRWDCLSVQRTVWLCDSYSVTMIGHLLKITSSVGFFSSHVATFSCQTVSPSQASKVLAHLPVLMPN